MKKNIILIIAILIIIFIIGFIIYFSIDKSKDSSIEVESTEKTKLDALKEILSNSNYFETSKLVSDTENNKITIDEKYDVYIKNGYYMMNIKDEKDEDTYCEVVDAVEQNFGIEAGKSIETCKKTLDGSINMGGINVEFYDNYKVLTVNSEEASSLYNINNSHTADELIFIDEINYDIKIDDYLFTSMSTGYTKDVKLFSICGHLYDDKYKEKTFIFKTYDVDKNEIAEKSYTYQNDTDKYVTFCVDFENDAGTAKYYSISE